MSTSMYLALRGAKLREQELETIAHNLANATTNGFKESKITFDTVLTGAQSGRRSSSEGPHLFPEAHTSVNFSDGPIQQTNNDLDVALQGEGFFEIQTSRGTFYTRDGSFALNSEGQMVSVHGGGVVSGTTGVINISEAGRMEISPSGVITINGAERGQIKVVNFEDPSALTPAGATLFKAPAGVSPIEAQGTSVLQGKVEASNVSVVQSLTQLIEISREYQAYQKVISNQNKLDQEAASTIARVT